MERLLMNRRTFFKLMGVGSGAVLVGNHRLPAAFSAESYPSKRISWIVYTKPGGGFDLIARTIAPFLEKYLKEASTAASRVEIAIKNVTAAGGLRAFETIYHAKPDGYTFGDYNTGSYAESLFSKPDLDLTKMTYFIRTGVSCRIIIANKNSFKSWDEMMKGGKEKELKWAVGNFGQGAHITAVLLKEAAKVPARLINFPGTAESMNALLRGDVHMAVATEEAGKALIEAGEISVLTVLSDTSRYPGVPSLVQLGYPQLAEPAKLHRVLMAPPNLPSAISDVLVAAFKKALSDPGFLENAKRVGFETDALYGLEADRVVKRIFKYYDENAPLLKKYLQ